MTPYPDCIPRDGTATADFVLPLNGTRSLIPAPGADVCWRRQLEPPRGGDKRAPPPGWTAWTRDYTSAGAFIDSRL
jgi:hypothetical protein